MLAASNICKRLYSRPIHSPPCAVDHANRLTQIKPLLDLERFSTQLVLHSDFRPAMTAGALSSLTAFFGELPRETRPNGLATCSAAVYCCTPNAMCLYGISQCP
jgi:hypothetical protein